MDEFIKHPGRTTEDKLVFMIEARLASRRLQGQPIPESIGCGSRLAGRIAGHRWKDPGYAAQPPGIRTLPMLRADTVFLLIGNRILDVVSSADPEPEPMPEKGT